MVGRRRPRRLVSDSASEAITPGTPIARLREITEQHVVRVDPAWVPGRVVDKVFEALVLHSPWAPTFVID